MSEVATAAIVAGAPGPAALLEVENLTIRFGGIVALDGVSFALRAGTVCGLIGPNGAGKTTLFNCLNGLYRPASGDIRMNGRSLVDLPPHRRADAGIGRTFQNVALFGSMSVRENVMVGIHSQTRSGTLANMLRTPRARADLAQAQARADELIGEVGLTGAAERRVESLPFGMQKKVELARALACSPQLLLLDEPAGGLSHEEVDQLRLLILRIRDRMGIAILLIEHHLNLVMRVSDQVVAINFGRTIADGSPQSVQANPEVIRAYLGKAADVPVAA